MHAYKWRYKPMTTQVERVDIDGLDKCCLSTIKDHPIDAVEGVELACRKCETPITYADMKWRRQKRE